jgi:hypothetical protein
MAIFTVSSGGDAAAAFDAALAEARLTPGGDTITIAAGTYELTRAIQLTQADSGTTFVADGEVTLSGGDRPISLINVDGASDITISGLNFTDTSGGGDFDSSLAAVRVENGAANITISDSDFTNVALGVQVYWGANHVTVIDSRFTDTWGPAIDFNDESFQNTASGNTILRSGAVYTEGGAIQMYESWGNLISHNSIRDIPRHGIEEQSWDATNRSGGNVIDSNRITNYMGATEDGGAIYLFGGDDPFTPIRTTITNNRIEGTADDFSWGIYMDDLVNGANVIGNWVDGGGVASLMIHGGDLNEVANNVLLNGGQYGITVQEGLVDPGPARLDNIHDNIIAPGEGIYGASSFNPLQFHDNLYIGENQYFGWDYETFEQWQASGGDRGSVAVTSIEGGIGDPDNPIDGPDLPGLPDLLPPDFDPDLPNFRPDWDPILGRPEPVPPEPEQPPPGEVGLDTLVLQLAAQYIQTAPSFIVSVDGEEVGEGEVTVRYGADNQTFEFRGDWGAGEHEVTLDFTNDNPIRNLWVEDVYYNDANYNPPGGDVNVGNLPGDRLTFTVGS